MGTRGEKLSQAIARELAADRDLRWSARRYEGVDERVRRYIDSREFSVATTCCRQGIAAAWCIVDA